MVKLRPKDIGELWEYISTAIIAGTIPGAVIDDELKANLLAALMNGKLWCWVLTDSIGPKCVITATVTMELFSSVRILTIYSAWFRQTPNSSEVKKLTRAFLGQAQQQGCSKIAGYTNNHFAATTLAKFPKTTPSIYMEVNLNG